MSELTTTTANQIATKPTTIAEAALALFSPLEADIATLTERYRSVAFDMTTPKGFKAAKDARQELREQGRFAVQRMRDKTKDQLNDCKKIVEAEASRLIALVEPVETDVDKQIKAHEQKLAEEKAERDRIENERRQKHLAAIDVIAGYVGKAEGLPIERIQGGLAYVRGIDVSAAVFEDFADRAAAQKQATIGALEKMISDAGERAAAEAMRAENARLHAQLAELQRQRSAPDSEPEPDLVVAIAPPAAPAPQQAPLLTNAVEEEVEREESAPALAPAPQLQAIERAPAANEPAASGVPTLRIGEIAARLGWNMTADQLRGLGIEPAGKDRAATLYHEHQFPAICAAVARRANEAAAAHAQRLAA